MIVELNTNLVPIFSGTYESPYWDIVECDDEGNELNVEYDFKDLMQSIVDAYNSAFQSNQIDLDIPWLRLVKFTGSQSPREYNFSTDTLDFTAEFNKAGAIEYLKTLENSEDFKQYLIDNFRSRDGFWSWTPDNYDDLLASIENEGDDFDQSIGALARYAMGVNEIEEIVAEDWRGNGYEGCNYSISEEE